MICRAPAPFRILSFLLLLAAFGSIFPATGRAQARRDIAILIAQVKAGAGTEVAKLLPALKKSHPDKAGVLLLEALLETNAEKAVELYQRVADDFPRSEWSDDALYRLYQYSYAVGAYRTARTYTDRIAKDFPQSPFLSREQRAAAMKAAKEAGTEKAAPQTTAKRTPPAQSAPTAEAPAEKPAAADAQKSYAVQVGAFSRKSDALKLSDELKTKGYTAYLREKTVNRKTVQAVWLGIFSDFSQAQAFARKLKEQQKIDAIVVRR